MNNFEIKEITVIPGFNKETALVPVLPQARRRNDFKGISLPRENVYAYPIPRLDPGYSEVKTLLRL